MIPPVFFAASIISGCIILVVILFAALMAGIEPPYGEWSSFIGKVAMICGAIVVLTAAIATPLELAANNQTHSGTHVGYVTAVETGGIVYKTTTVYIKTNLESTQEDKYCIEDPVLAEALRQYAEDNKRVEITFTTHFLWSEGCPHDSDSTIRSVREMAT